MTADTYTFWSVAAGDWVTKCAGCGAWWLAVHRFPHHCSTVHPVRRDPHPSDGCGLCGWDGAEGTTPCPAHVTDVAAWNARNGVTA